MKPLPKKYKIALCYLGLFLLFLSMGNSNNNPVTFLERIIRPMHVGSMTFYPAGLIGILAAYYCLKQLYKLNGNSLINTAFRRIIVTFILLVVFSNLSDFGTQLYKGFSHNLNAIYLDRNKTSIQLEGDQESLAIDGIITFKNCSNTKQTFNIKIKTPALIREMINEDYIILENVVTLYPKSIQTLYLNEELKINAKNKAESKISWAQTHAFEYIIFNNQDEAIFKGDQINYEINDSYLH